MATQVGGISRTNVCERYRPLVNRTVRQLDVAPSMREDALQEGMIGLLRAYDRYDKSSPVTFGVFARPYVKGAIIRGLYGTTKVANLDVIPVGDIHDLAGLEDPDTDPEAGYVENTLLYEWLDTLAPVDSWLIWARFWKDATTAEIASELGRTDHWVNERQRTLLARAVSHMGRSN